MLGDDSVWGMTVLVSFGHGSFGQKRDLHDFMAVLGMTVLGRMDTTMDSKHA